jgi:hypothetical protein
MTHDEIEQVSTEEAIAEVRRWLASGGVDPEAVFTASGDSVIRYKDLIGHLEAGTPDGELLRFAISRGRLIRRPARPGGASLLQISPPVGREPESDEDAGEE